MKGVQRLPRYRDPIARNVARLLLRGLQEQHLAPSNTVIEFEARFGQQLAQVSTRRFEFPVATATAAIVDSLHNSLFTFNPGVSRAVRYGVEQALVETGLFPAVVFNRDAHLFLREDVLLCMEGDERIICAFGPLSEMERRAETIRHSAASSSSSPPLMRQTPENAFRLSHGLLVEGVVRKERVAYMDMCCPDWCADLRFAVSSESTMPADASAVLGQCPVLSRHRNRLSLPVSPFFTVEITFTLSHSSQWWHPSKNPSVHHSAAEATAPAVGTVIPCPRLDRTESGERAVHGHPTRRTSTGSKGVAAPPDGCTAEVEVEVNVPAVLREWKKVYGGAAASAYLSSAARVSTTLAGTSMVGSSATSFSSSSASSAGHLSRDHVTEADVRAHALAEREDPFLLRVAEEYLALLQHLAQIRTTD